MCIRRLLLLASACGRVGFDRLPDAALAASVEAESGAVVSNFQIVADPTASGGAYVVDGNNDGGSGPGSLTLRIPIAADGTYYAWFRSIAPNTSNDSFVLAIDGGSPFDLETSGTCAFGAFWQWSPITPMVSCPNARSPMPLAWTAGAHTLLFTSREGRSLVDAVIVSADATYRPQ